MKAYKKANGFALQTALIVLTLVSLLGLVVFKSIQNSRRQSQLNIEEAAVSIYVSAAAETLLPALDLSESKYMEFVNGCDKSVDFLEALISGHGCPTVGSIDIFTSNDVSLLDPPEQKLFQYFSGWTISRNSVSPASKNAVVRIPLVSPYSVEFYVDAILPQKSWIIMNAIVLKSGIDIYSRKVSFTLNSQNYRVHLESSNNKVTQERPDPSNPCINGDWMPYLHYKGGACSAISQLGGTVGLGFYKNIFFGLRDYDGQIVDLEDTSPITNLVKEDGTLAGVPVFPPYKASILQAVSDFEIVGEDSNQPQIYFVKGFGVNVAISYLDAANDTSFPVCNLGALGWAQSYSGISASSGSAPLIPVAPQAPFVSIANFTLKSDTGDLFNLRVRSQKNPGTFSAGLPAAAVITNGSVSRTFVCTIQKQKIPPAPEYQRTLGMTQSGANRKRFSLL